MATYDLTSSIPSSVAAGDILNCPYSGTYKQITLPPGKYQLACWGAQGGSYGATSTTSVNLTTSTITSYFTVTNGSNYYFAGSDSTWTSNNAGVASSSATTTLTAKSSISGTISYTYSSEAKYDKFTMVVAGTTVLNAVSGATTSGTYAFSVTSGQTISFTYSKDSSVNKNDDKCTFQIQVDTTTTNITYAGGCGGYATGILSLKSATTLFLYAGGQGSMNTASDVAEGGGFNGGGNTTTTSSKYKGCGGGGGSDIRIDTDSLYARVIVAGGGGGAFGATNGYGVGGYGGGSNGGDGASSSTSYTSGKGGKQTTYGESYYGTSVATTTRYTPAAFGTGSSRKTSSSYGSAGGGGWYGGGSARRAGGGGGSGYIYTSSTASNYPSGCLLGSSYYLTNASTLSGASSFTDPESGLSVTGRSGNGYVRITVIEITSDSSSFNIWYKTDTGTWKQVDRMFRKVNGTWKELDAIYHKVNSVWKQT